MATEYTSAQQLLQRFGDVICKTRQSVDIMTQKDIMTQIWEPLSESNVMDHEWCERQVSQLVSDTETMAD